MPTRATPEPGENEFECANCGAYFHYELTRCPNCGISLYEPEEQEKPQGPGLLGGIRDAWHRLFKKPYRAEDIFGDALDASILYNDLLQRLSGDRPAAERLIDIERAQQPKSTRRGWIQSAIQRWDRDNHIKK